MEREYKKNRDGKVCYIQDIWMHYTGYQITPVKDNLTDPTQAEIADFEKKEKEFNLRRVNHGNNK